MLQSLTQSLHSFSEPPVCARLTTDFTDSPAGEAFAVALSLRFSTLSVPAFKVCLI